MSKLRPSDNRRRSGIKGSRLSSWASVSGFMPQLYPCECCPTSDAAEPGKGYADKAAEWRGKLDELNAETQKRQNTEKSENQGDTEGG